MLGCYRWLGRTRLDKLRLMPQSPDDPFALLREAIRVSGLSARSFAETLLVREERTVRRWIAGEAPIPDVVIRFLQRYLATHPQP